MMAGLRAALCFHQRATFCAVLTHRTAEPCVDFWMRERSGRHDVPEIPSVRSRELTRLPIGDRARRASEADATTEERRETERQ